MKLLIGFILTLGVCFFSASIYAEKNEAFNLYQKVLSGQKSLEQLTPEQQSQVIMIHSTMNRNSCNDCSDECRENKEQAESYRSDLEGYTRRLLRCIEGNDLSDDCYSEFRRVKSTHDDFESAISNANSTRN